MNTLPDFNAAHIDSDEFRDFIRKFARPKAMEGWDREKTFQRGGQKTAAEKDARWIGQAAKWLRGNGGGLASGVAQLPLRAVERGAHMGKTLGQNIAAGYKGTPGAAYFPGSAGVDRISRGSPGGRTALSLGGTAALGLTGAAAMSGGSPAAAAATHNPSGAPAPVKTPAVAPKAQLDGKSDGPLPPSQRSVAPAAPTAAAAPAAAPAAQLDGKSDGPLPPSQRSIAAAPAAAPAVAAAPSPRAKITQQNAGTIVAFQRAKGRQPTEQDLMDFENERLAARAKRPKQPSYAMVGGQRLELDEATGQWMPKAAAEKTAADTKDILRWLLGSALIGAGARTSVSLYNNLTAPPPLKASDQLYDPEIEIPIDFTPEQMAKYKALSSPAAKKTAAAWDNTLAALTMTGGGALGWSLAHAMIRRQKEKALDARLQKLRDELAQLSQPEIASVAGPDAPKLAAAQDFFHIAAERYQKHIKEAAVPRQILDLVAKAKRLGGQGLQKGKDTWQGMDPMMKVLAAGGAGLAAAPLLPGVRHITGGVGDVATGGVLEGLKTVGRPIGYGAAATLGPVAALGALYALYKGYETAEKDDPQTKELKALREAIREREIEERPYFKLTPRVQESAA